MPVILTAFQRLAGVIGQIIVENAQLGEEVEKLRAEVAIERARTEAAEQRLKDAEAKAAQVD